MVEKFPAEITDRYFDTELRCIVKAKKATEYGRFFNAVHGPHGSVMPGQWFIEDPSAFKVAFDEEDFQKRFIQIRMQQLCWKSDEEEDFPWVWGT
jgi:hypothetical protein